MRTKKYTLYVVCADAKCVEPVQVDRFDNKQHYCVKCAKKRAKQPSKSK